MGIMRFKRSLWLGVVAGALLQLLRGRQSILAILSALSLPAFAAGQAADPTNGPWSGSAVCTVSVNAGANYSHNEIQSWTLTGSTPAGTDGALKVYSASWTVTTYGSYTLAATAQRPFSTGRWSMTAPAANAPLAIGISPADGLLYITARHNPIRVSGTGEVLISNTPGQSTTSPLTFQISELTFPAIQAKLDTTSISGMVPKTPIRGMGPHQPPDATGYVSCTWQFVRGGAGGARGTVPDRTQTNARNIPQRGIPPGTGTLPQGTQTPTNRGSNGVVPTSAAVVILSPPALLQPTAPPAGGVAARTGGPNATPPTERPAPSNVPNLARAGNYLVTITGLISGKNTVDSPFGLDGQGDEVYAAAFVRKYDRRTFTLLESSARQTFIYGDSNNSNRIQAGTVTRLGGIRTYDRIPGDLSVARLVPAQESLFPWKVWQGPLTDGADALVISPSIWESDGDQSPLSAWVSNQNSLNDRLFVSTDIQNQITAQRFGAQTLTTTGTQAFNSVLTNAVVKSNLDVFFSATTGLPLGTLLFSGSTDRPIGLMHSSVTSTALPNRVLVLTREIIEAALSTPLNPVISTSTPGVVITAPKPGIMVIEFVESLNGPDGIDNGVYYMILQVERI